jgi:PhnB protein
VGYSSFYQLAQKPGANNMTVKTVTHLNFRGDARAALEFYHSVFGGSQVVVAYKDTGNVQDSSEADQVMWGQVVADNGFRVMAYDVPSRMSWNPGEIPFFVVLRGDTADEITAFWTKLSVDATIMHSLGPALWSPLYGMLKDRFGVTWVLDIENNSAA